MANHIIVVKKNTFLLLDEAKKEFIRHHKEFENVRISNNKIIYEALQFYLKV